MDMLILNNTNPTEVQSHAYQGACHTFVKRAFLLEAYTHSLKSNMGSSEHVYIFKVTYDKVCIKPKKEKTGEGEGGRRA
jgi:hypothetical protein